MTTGKQSETATLASGDILPVSVLTAVFAFVIVIATGAISPFSEQESLAYEWDFSQASDVASSGLTLLGRGSTEDSTSTGEESDGLSVTGDEWIATVKSPPPSEMQLEMEGLSQLPELPCGCEITAAASLLNYRGIDVSAVTLDGYLAQGWDNLNPHEQFIGYCASSGWTCYVEPVAQACNAYLEEIGLADSYVAIDLTGISAQELYDDYIAQGIPVCVWATTYLQERGVAYSWYVGDEYVSVSRQDHCMALCGYTQDSVTLMDPLEGETVQYPRSAFEESFASRDFRAMAVIGA